MNDVMDYIIQDNKMVGQIVNYFNVEDLDEEIVKEENKVDEHEIS